MWDNGKQKLWTPRNVNERILSLDGYLEDKKAQIELVRFLKSNIGLATKLITGVDLFPFQEMLIKTMFMRDYPLFVLSRGMSKTFSSGVFAALLAVLEPESRIAIISVSFRQARLTFQKIEEIMAKPEAALLMEALNKPPRHMQDEWKMQFGSSEILACPLGDGSKLRGFRFNCLIIDELLLMPEKILNEVLLPFLSVNVDPHKRQKVWDDLTELVEAGALTKQERMDEMNKVFRSPKMIGLTSASFKFEYLYQMYSSYIKKICSGTEDGKELKADLSNQLKGSYAVYQLAYDMAPQQLYSEALLERQRSEMSDAQFQREFGAQFTDDSSGYFNVRAMEDCTVDYGDTPVFELKGDGSSDYILAIDPSFSENQNSDFFAMSVFKVRSDKKLMLVHCYAVAGGKLKDHIRYFKYLFTYFNLKLIFMDNAGGVQFMNSINESKMFSESEQLKRIDGVDFNKQDGYLDEIREAKRDWNVSDRRIVYMQTFNSDWIRKANELLQASIDRRQIVFAGNATAVEAEMTRLLNLDVKVKELIFDNDEESESKIKGMSTKDVLAMKQLDLIERQQFLITLTKRQCALIEVKSTDQGRQTFTLPQELKRQQGRNKARRDLYTTLLIGTWAYKVYCDLMNTEEKKRESFMPMFLN